MLGLEILIYIQGTCRISDTSKLKWQVIELLSATNLVRKSGRKRPPGRPLHRWKNNIRMKRNKV
jgi:hypothetical protein